MLNLPKPLSMLWIAYCNKIFVFMLLFLIAHDEQENKQIKLYIRYVCWFFLYCVPWISSCQPADQIFPKLSAPTKRLSSPVWWYLFAHFLRVAGCFSNCTSWRLSFVQLSHYQRKAQAPLSFSCRESEVQSKLFCVCLRYWDQLRTFLFCEYPLHINKTTS